MIKVLAVGNSFSQDATYYLHQIAAADGVDMKAVNLFIGGCSLERHWANIVNDAAEYQYEENGKSTERLISVKGALESDDWDYIVTQQASHDSGIVESYYPYLEKIADYIRKKAPNAELLLHETWAYEKDSTHGCFGRYGKDQAIMYEKLSKAYHSVANKLGLRLIPSGDIIQDLRTKEPFVYERGGLSLCRDGFHMDLIYGRYLLAAVWYKFLTGNSVVRNSYVPRTEFAPNASCEEKILNVVKRTVDEAVL